MGMLKGDLLWRSAGYIMGLVWGTLNLSGIETSRENVKLALDHIVLKCRREVQNQFGYLLIEAISVD